MNNDYKIEDQLADKRSQSSCKQSKSRKLKKPIQKNQKQKTPKITNFFKKLKYQAVKLQQKTSLFNIHGSGEFGNADLVELHQIYQKTQLLKPSWSSSKNIPKRTAQQQIKIQQLKIQQRQLLHQEQTIKKQIQTIKSEQQLLYDEGNIYSKKLRQYQISNIKQRYEIIRTKKVLPDLKRIAAGVRKSKIYQEMNKFEKVNRMMCQQEDEMIKNQEVLDQEILAIKQKIFKKEKIISQLTRAGSLSFYQKIHLQKDISNLKIQLSIAINQHYQHKQRMNLEQKQKSCKFALMNWPLINKKYQTLQLLGSGGYSEVYKAYNIQNSQYVAIKLCSVSQMAQVSSELYLKHLFRECQTHKQLDNQNIVRLYQVVEMDKSTFCMMLEYCQGPQLSKYIKRKGYVEQDEAQAIMFQIFQSLYYLSHYSSKKIVHYDLKPQNIMFNQGLIKILDFGLTKHIDEQQSRAALTSLGMGTDAYLPPQIHQIHQNDQKVLTNKVDIWSAGIIFYQLLHGKRPTTLNDLQMQNNIQKQKIQQQTIDIIRSCLKLNPEERISPRNVYFHKYFDKFQRKYKQDEQAEFKKSLKGQECFFK